MTTKPIIILGSGNSGSGAIKDCLLLRNDIFDPLDGQEFRLIQEKNGLSCLYKSLTSEFHPDKSSYAIIQFIELARRLGNPSKKISLPPLLGYNYIQSIPGYYKEIEDFIHEISSSSIKVTHLHDLLSLGTLDWIRYMNGYIPKFKNIDKPIPVTKDIFLDKAQTLIKKLFFENKHYPTNKEGYLFDQAGSFWSPVSSTKYFGDQRKVIVISRDPRDIYTQNINLYGGGVKDFTKYYNSIMKHISKEEWFHDSVLHVEFEKFVLNYDEEYKRICNFLNINYEITSSYDPYLSRKNIGVYKEKLKEEDANLIMESCIKVGVK
jgi:hypothetical protein